MFVFNSSPSTPAPSCDSCIKEEPTVKETETPELINSTKDLAPEKRANIGFGLRHKQQKVLLEKEFKSTDKISSTKIDNLATNIQVDNVTLKTSNCHTDTAQTFAQKPGQNSKQKDKKIENNIVIEDKTHSQSVQEKQSSRKKVLKNMDELKFPPSSPCRARRSDKLKLQNQTEENNEKDTVKTKCESSNNSLKTRTSTRAKLKSTEIKDKEDITEKVKKKPKTFRPNSPATLVVKNSPARRSLRSSVSINSESGLDNNSRIDNRRGKCFSIILLFYSYFMYCQLRPAPSQQIPHLSNRIIRKSVG